ncbi:carotenoid oxygenase family protein [Kitasatospora sp. CB01950]|uniref:carotenoid oxygenase family protein n=1 Tax=Kitasatospora sp. CB01950 TaxID=1703930 RepID=UPI003FCC972F
MAAATVRHSASACRAAAAWITGSPAAAARSELLVLDTVDFTGPPVVTVPLVGTGAARVPRAVGAGGVVSGAAAVSGTGGRSAGSGRPVAAATVRHSASACRAAAAWITGSPAATDRSELLVLDTVDFTGPPVVTVPLPARVPHGFHAQWVPAKW